MGEGRGEGVLSSESLIECLERERMNDNWFFNEAYIKYISENWIEVSVLVELRTVRIMTQGDSNLRPLWRDQQP